MTALRAIATCIVVPLQDAKDGVLADETIELRLHNEGGGSFVSMKCQNLSPSDDYDAHTVTFYPSQLRALADIADRMLDAAGDRGDKS